jgi:hypothetical protein
MQLVRWILVVTKNAWPIKILAYNFASHACNEYVKLGDNIAMKALERYVKEIKELYESTYLRQTTQKNLQKKMSFNKKKWG